MKAMRNLNSVFLSVFLFFGVALLSCQAKAATVYWGFCSITFDDGWTEYGEHGVIVHEPYRPTGGILDVLDYDNPVYEYGVPLTRWVPILEFAVDYDLEKGIVTYSGGLSGSAKFGETVRLYYSVLLLDDGSTPAVGYVDFRYEDEPTREIYLESSYVSFGDNAALPTPEPSCAIMVTLGVAFLLLRRRSV